MTNVVEMLSAAVAVLAGWTIIWWTAGWLFGYIHSFVRDDDHIEFFWDRNATRTRGGDGDPSR